MSEKTRGPLVLEPIFKERIWGAQALPAPYPQPAPDKPIGEVWLTAEECKVSDGDFAGKTLGEVLPNFPLLMKVLLPKEKLSVQVHPNDLEAQALGEPRGKTECWYVLEADPGAQVALGLKPGVAVNDLSGAIADGSMEEKLQMLPVKAGDMVFVDAGTVHAIGPGMVVLETQEYSDITYRLYDYGRPRELHVERGLAVTKAKTKAGLVAPIAMDGFTRLVQSEYFAVDRFELSANENADLHAEDALQILFALTDGVSVRRADGSVEARLPKGQAVVLPAGDVGFTLRTHSAAAVVRVLEP